MNFPIKFIKATEKYCTFEEYVNAPYFRHNFVLDKKPIGAELVITGLGFYEVYFNGKNITKGFLAPYRSNIDDYIYYDKYEISKKLKIGNNTIGIILGNGMRNGFGAKDWCFWDARFRGAPTTAFELKITYSDGTEEIIESGTNTKTAPSPIIFDDLHYGEYYDATLEINGWANPDFDDSEWENALPTEAPRGEGRFCEAEPIVVRNTYKPVSIEKYVDSYVYDFGINSSGLCKLKIKGKKGQKILLQYFETLKDGKPFLNNCRRYDRPGDRVQEDEYYCSGKGVEEYTPRFTYHGFRYVLVTGITEKQAGEDLLTYLEMSSDIKRTGNFVCSDEVVNKIQEAAVRSDYSNFWYIPTDCPQREKNGWTADAALSAEHILLNMNPEKSYAEWMRNVYKAMDDKGALPGIIPTTGWGFEWGNGPAWDSALVWIPYYTYKYRGNKEILKELATPLMRYLNYILGRLDENGTLEIGLGDWCPVRYQKVVDNGTCFTPLVVTDTIMTYDIALKSAFIFEQLNLMPQKQFALALAERVKQGFRENLIDKTTMTIFSREQTAQAMAIYYGLLEEDEKAKALDVLLEIIHENDDRFDCGVLGGRIIFRLLADNGYEELAYEMLTRPEFPSYGNWIARGATSLWESFYPTEGCHQMTRIDSLNHCFWGDVSAWFYIYLAGIRVNPTVTDCSNIDIKPYFISKLEFVKADHETPAGKVAVEWKRENNGVILKIDAAEGLHGVIALPQGYTFEDASTEKELISGEYRITKK